MISDPNRAGSSPARFRVSERLKIRGSNGNKTFKSVTCRACDTPHFDGSHRHINDLLYTWTRNYIGRAAVGHTGETYRVDDTILPASPMAICMLLTDSSREFPRGRCLAINQADAGITEYSPPDGDPLTFMYDDAGNIETIERADGTVWQTSFGCWT